MEADALPSLMLRTLVYGVAVRFGDVDMDRDIDIVGLPDLVLCNYRRQLAVPSAPQIGANMQIDAYARFGPWRWVDVAFVFVADAPAAIPIEPLGILGIDPARAVGLPPFLIPSGLGTASTTFPIPGNPAFTGLPLHVQMVLAQLPDGFFLSNVTVDLIVGV